MAVDGSASATSTAPATGLHGDFSLLWAARAVSDLGSSITMVALPLVAVVGLRAPAEQVAAVAAAGSLAGALLALPLGSQVEYRLKRPAMILTDLVRAACLITVPVAAILGLLSLVQLCVVAFVIACAGIVFNAASQAHLKALVGVDHLGAATGRLESTLWFANLAGPPLGGAIVGLLARPARCSPMRHRLSPAQCWYGAFARRSHRHRHAQAHDEAIC